LYLLDREPRYLYNRLISTLSHMQNPGGGFGGGPGQMSHGAPTYAGVLALCTVGSDDALATINRAAMYSFFLSMKAPEGGFRMHRDGELDCRGTYCFVAIAKLLNILTPELAEGVAEFLLSCQTYEGGFGGEPYNEAHGGYNFCALAALLILGEAHRCDVEAQERWLLNRQTRLEGGFQGRTNKLVDSCYSFWQGGAGAVLAVIKQGGSDLYDLDIYLQKKGQTIVDTRAEMSPPAAPTSSGKAGSSDSAEVLELDQADRIASADDLAGDLGFNQKALQRYILHCAQNIDGGGLRDKPGKHRDYYHSCYALSGLSVAQNFAVGSLGAAMGMGMGMGGGGGGKGAFSEAEMQNLPQVFGAPDNLLNPTSVVYNIGLEKLCKAVRYFHYDTEGRPVQASHAELLAAAGAGGASAAVN
jgi:protein farnesyltransferase subunit beta